MYRCSLCSDRILKLANGTLSLLTTNLVQVWPLCVNPVRAHFCQMNTCHSIFLRNWVSPLIRLSVLSNYMCSDMIFHLPPSHHSSETPFHFDSSSSSRQQKVRGGQRDGEGRDGSQMQYAVEVQCHHSQLQLEVHSNISLKEKYEKGELTNGRENFKLLPKFGPTLTTATSSLSLPLRFCQKVSGFYGEETTDALIADKLHLYVRTFETSCQYNMCMC